MLVLVLALAATTLTLQSEWVLYPFLSIAANANLCVNGPLLKTKLACGNLWFYPKVIKNMEYQTIYLRLSAFSYAS